MNQTRPLQNICVFGVGGVGGFFGGKLTLARHHADQKISFIARGAHLEAIRKNGLILNTTEKQGLICKPDVVSHTLAECPLPDCILLCVKGYALPEALEAIKPYVQDHTILLPLLNGVDIYERICTILDKGIVLPACVYVGTHIEKPGMVSQKGGTCKILIGKDYRYPHMTLSPLIKLFKHSAIHYEIQKDPAPAIWGKYIFIASFGLVTAFSGKTLGAVMEDDHLKNKARSIMEEIEMIARKKGIHLPSTIVEDSLNKALNFPHETKTSYQRDIETTGKADEGELFGGTIIRIGQELDIPTDVTRHFYEVINQV